MWRTMEDNCTVSRPRFSSSVSEDLLCHSASLPVFLDKKQQSANTVHSLNNFPGVLRPSRWGDVHIEPVSPVFSVSLSSSNQAGKYAITLRLQEIERELSLNKSDVKQSRSRNDVAIVYRLQLEEERVALLARIAHSDCMNSVAEPHLQRRARPSDKVYIPSKEFPDINFFGLLVGPRGNSLKKIERESGAKISIRGKGSVKEGKNRPEFLDDTEEDLHCLVIGETEEKVAACVKLINKVIETAVMTPDGQNDHKRCQLRELAALNGTLRDFDGENTSRNKFPTRAGHTTSVECQSTKSVEDAGTDHDIAWPSLSSTLIPSNSINCTPPQHNLDTDSTLDNTSANKQSWSTYLMPDFASNYVDPYSCSQTA